MGTRSRIAVMHGDVIKSIYCHWDGYISHNGQILEQYYDSARANQLVALGDISSLRQLIEIPEGVEHSFDNASPNVTVFYGRDRGQEDVSWKVDHTFADFLTRVDSCGADYYYVMRDGVWYVGNVYKGDKIVPLAQALAESKIEA